MSCFPLPGPSENVTHFVQGPKCQRREALAKLAKKRDNNGDPQFGQFWEQRKKLFSKKPRIGVLASCLYANLKIFGPQFARDEFEELQLFRNGSCWFFIIYPAKEVSAVNLLNLPESPEPLSGRKGTFLLRCPTFSTSKNRVQGFLSPFSQIFLGKSRDKKY